MLRIALHTKKLSTALCNCELHARNDDDDDAENHIILRWLVISYSGMWQTDRRTDGQQPIAKLHSSIAVHDKDSGILWTTCTFREKKSTKRTFVIREQMSQELSLHGTIAHQEWLFQELSFWNVHSGGTFAPIQKNIGKVVEQSVCRHMLLHVRHCLVEWKQHITVVTFHFQCMHCWRVKPMLWMIGYLW